MCVCVLQMKSLATREQNQKNAAYNLGVAEAIRRHKNEKPEFYVRILLHFLLLTSALSVSLWLCLLYCRFYCTPLTFTIQLLFITATLINYSNSQPGTGTGGRDAGS